MWWQAEYDGLQRWFRMQQQLATIREKISKPWRKAGEIMTYACGLLRPNNAMLGTMGSLEGTESPAKTVRSRHETTESNGVKETAVDSTIVNQTRMSQLSAHVINVRKHATKLTDITLEECGGASSQVSQDFVEENTPKHETEMNTYPLQLSPCLLHLTQREEAASW